MAGGLFACCSCSAPLVSAATLPLLLASLVAMMMIHTASGSVDACSTDTDGGGYYYSNWCGKPPPENLQFLDDRDCAKRFPTNCSRQWRCPVASRQAPPAGAGWAAAAPLSAVSVDTAVLAAVPQLRAVKMAVVLVRRTASDGIFYRYFGGPNYTEPFETWSSSKIFAMANAAVTVERQCPAIGGLPYGLSSLTHGKLGPTPLGDLATIICSYDRTKNYTSNSLARYFHDLGGRQQANWLVQEWLGVGASQSFGGNYGEPSPPDLGFTLTAADRTGEVGRATAAQRCELDPDHSGVIIPNALSALSMVELLKRIVLHRELPPGLRLPGVQWADMEQELYGNGGGNESLFPGVFWGGMSADTAIFMQDAAHNTMDNGDPQAGGNWRVFSKLGAGFSSSRHVGEIVHNAYGCFPAAGVELLYSAQASVPGDVELHAAESALRAGITAGVRAVLRAAERLPLP